VSERSAGAPGRGEAFSKGELLCLCRSARRRVYAEGIADARWHSLRSPMPPMIGAAGMLANANFGLKEVWDDVAELFLFFRTLYSLRQ